MSEGAKEKRKVEIEKKKTKQKYINSIPQANKDNTIQVGSWGFVLIKKHSYWD